MCTNAMIYSKPESIYYEAAKKLLGSGVKILSQGRIQSLRQSIGFTADWQKKLKAERVDRGEQSLLAHRKGRFWRF